MCYILVKKKISEIISCTKTQWRSSMKVLNIGSLNIDRVYEVEQFVKPGETIKTTHYSEACGGKA